MLTTLLTILVFWIAARKQKIILIIIGAWIILQGSLSILGFYKIDHKEPQRFVLMLIPPLGLIALLFFMAKGKQFIDSLDLKVLTILQTVRIPVEIVLYFLYIYNAVPLIMTFGGRNFDILAGLTAPVIYYFGFCRNRMNYTAILIWNILCIGLLANIVIIAVLSLRTPFQKFGLDQPNIAVLYFPFVWLPSAIVPLVLFSHLSSIRQILKVQKKSFESPL
jgi:hypothetical protein